MHRIMFLITIIYAGLFAAQNHVTMPPDAEVNTGYPIPYSGYRQSPGIVVGFTDYDWMYHGYYFSATSSGGYHFLWIYRDGGNNATRCSYYNYFFPPSYWLGAMPVFPPPSIATGLNQMADGRALITANVYVAGNWRPIVCIDAGEGYGSFTIFSLPVPNPLDPILWPVPCVDADDNIFISGTSGDGLHTIKSTDEGNTWSDWILVDSTGDHESWATFTGKTALVYQAGSDFENVYYWETTDNGVTWSVDTVFIPSPQDSVVGYMWNSAVYDNNGYLHVVFTCIDTSPAGQGGQNCSGCRSQIRHWNQQTGQISLVASGWWTLDPGPGTIHPTVSECQIAIDRASGTLYCTWCQADSGDVAANGYTNLEIYGAYSTDNGTTWSAPVNITNSQSPGASAGYCDHDWWQSIADIAHSDTIYLFYMNDKDAGSSVWGEGIPTDNPMLFYPYCFSVGIEEHKPKEPLKLTLHVTPNPVSDRSTVAYALSTSGEFSLRLFDACGRSILTIDEGKKPSGHYMKVLNLGELPNGTYFVVLQTNDSKLSTPLILIR